MTTKATGRPPRVSRPPSQRVSGGEAIADGQPAFAEEVAKQPVLAAELATAQRLRVIEDEDEARPTPARERVRLALEEFGDRRAKVGNRGGRRDPRLPLQLRRIVEKRIDHRGEQEAGAVVVEFDKLKSALGRKMEVPGAEKTDFAPMLLDDCRRVDQRRRPPPLARRHPVEDANEAGDVGEQARGEDLRFERDRKALRQSGVAEGREQAV